jgi:hypothetical protein
MHDVHLERFDLKVPVVAAIWTSQRHLDSPTQHSWVGERLFFRTTDSNEMVGTDAKEFGAKWPSIAKSGQI